MGCARPLVALSSASPIEPSGPARGGQEHPGRRNTPRRPAPRCWSCALTLALDRGARPAAAPPARRPARGRHGGRAARHRHPASQPRPRTPPRRWFSPASRRCWSTPAATRWSDSPRPDATTCLLVVYTHYHSDHIAELGEILVNRAIAGATEPLPVIGPTGVKSCGRRLPRRLRSRGQLPRRAPRRALELGRRERRGHRGEAPGVVWEKDGLRVTMFDVDHAPVVPAVGYKFEYNGKSVVVSGDTKPTTATIEMARGADLLVHEAVDRATIDQVLPMIETRQPAPRRDDARHDVPPHDDDRARRDRARLPASRSSRSRTWCRASRPPMPAEANFSRGMAAIYTGTDRDGS